MCIIIQVNNSKNIPSDDIIKTCYQSNKDGFGYMIGYQDKVEIKKDIYTLDEILFEINELRKMKLNNPIAFHFRLSTGGIINKENCHPFLINERVGFMHNGILSLNPTDKKSDTKILSELLSKLPEPLYNNENFIELLSIYCKSDRAYTNKFLFFVGDRAYRLNSCKWIQDKKVYYSNEGYKQDYWLSYLDNKWNKKSSNSFKSKYKSKKYFDTVKCSGCNLQFFPEELNDDGLCLDCYEWASATGLYDSKKTIIKK